MLSPSPQLSSAETSHQLLLTLRILATSPTTRICGRDSPLMPATLSRTNFLRQSANATIRQSFTKFAIYLSKLAVPFMSRRTLSGKTCSIFSLSLWIRTKISRSMLPFRSSMDSFLTSWTTWSNSRLIWWAFSQKLSTMLLWTLILQLSKQSRTFYRLLRVKMLVSSWLSFHRWHK